MRTSIIYSLISIVVIAGCSGNDNSEFILVKGGISKNPKSNLYGSNMVINDFYIGRYEINQKQWTDVMGYNPSHFKGDSLPVETVSWYNCIEYCIARSLKEDLVPYYTIDSIVKDSVNICEYDSIKWLVTINPGANGYHLPTEIEWEYAASGGSISKGYTYSGSNNINQVAWYWKNSGDNELSGSWSWSNLEKNKNKTKSTGSKLPNELGIFDMSGNVREWCEDWYVDYETIAGQNRSQRGGGWIGADYRCEIANRDNFEPNGKGPDQGFRICRNANTAK